MPETAIGLIPDVGSTWLLTRPGGHLGTHLALTGSIVDAADAIEAGLADVMIDSASIPLLLTALETSDVDAALAQFTREPPASALAGRRDWIDELYAAPSVAVVLDRLRQSGVAEARSAAELIESRSPSAVMAAFEAITRARLMTRLTDVLNQEHRVMLHLAAAPDFFEGVRAQVVDKDRKPHWNPRSIGQVHPDTVLANFDPLEGYPDLFSGEEPTCR
jgi:enoyl-CoA hydratase